MVREAKQHETQYAIPANEIPPLADGERYIGAIVTDDPTLRHHLILLPGDNDGAAWQKQMDWAKSIGGDLPNRAEQAILFAVARDQFKPYAYWSNELDAEAAGYAWCQYFGYGGQDYYYAIIKLRARAVRRVPIQ